MVDADGLIVASSFNPAPSHRRSVADDVVFLAGEPGASESARDVEDYLRGLSRLGVPGLGTPEQLVRRGRSAGKLGGKRCARCPAQASRTDEGEGVP